MDVDLHKECEVAEAAKAEPTWSEGTHAKCLCPVADSNQQQMAAICKVHDYMMEANCKIHD